MPTTSTAAADGADVVVDAWWSSILAGDVDEPHPTYGPALKVHLDGSRLGLSGELESADDLEELIRQARKRVGRGIDRVDASDLRIARHDEQAGILDQTLISAFPNRQAAEYARAFVIKHSRVEPKHHEIVVQEMAQEMLQEMSEGQEDHLSELLPEDIVAKARKWLEAGQAILILTVDETAAHRVRELLEEDTRSQWTIAAPPTLSESRR